MRKYGILTMALAVLMVVGMFFTHLSTNHQGQNITTTETTLAGDFDAAKGIEVDTEIQIDYDKSCMAWDTITTLGEEIKSKTTVTQGEPIIEEYYRFSLDTLLTSGGTYVEDGYDLTDRDFNNQIPSKVLQDLAKTIGPGETVEKTVDLSDYIDTTQMDYILDSYDPNRNYVRALSVMDDDEDLFRSYFLVDMPETYPVTFTVTKNEEGRVNSANYICEAECYTSASAYVAADCIYLAVNGYTYGEDFYPLKDDRYSGILQIPLHQTRQLQIREIEKLCDLPAEVFIEKLTLSPDGKSLLLLTLEDGTACLSVFDKEILNLEQKIDLQFSDDLYKNEITSVSVGDDYFAAITYNGDYVILQYKDGLYAHFTEGRFDLTKLKEDNKDFNFWHAAFATDFDNNKAAVAALAYDEDYDITPSYALQVRSQKDLLYYGIFDSSLTDDLTYRDVYDYDIDIDFVQ